MPQQLKLGERLIAAGLLGKDQLRIALQEQGQMPQPLGKLLVTLGFLSEAVLRQALSESLGAQSIDLAQAVIEPGAIMLIPRTLAKRYHLLPISHDAQHKRLVLALSSPQDLLALDQVRAHVGSSTRIELLLAGEREIDQAIERNYDHELSIEGILHELETGEALPESRLDVIEDASQPVARLIDAIMADAVSLEASDIHLEPEAGFMRIRYRIDGLLRQVRVLHKSYWPAMSVRVKVMAGMNIAEMRAPQDGSFGRTVGGRVIDFRVASQPTLHGENIVLRILDRQKGIVPLEKLGLSPLQLQQLKRMVARPEGIILITGPTGSGKTTTLYSLINHIDCEGIHIMTLEDPVEYPLARIRQTSISTNARLNFANGIRSMMRQDPDVILVGEIRDAETAEMTFRAAMTGHQVYATLHANSAIGAIPRLLDSGVLPGIMAGNIIGIIAQRLIRRLCEHCKSPYTASAEETRMFSGLSEHPLPALYRPIGCVHCAFQGYRGRLAIMELLRVDGELDELLASQASPRQILSYAKQRGFSSLADDGLRRVLDGSTSLDELCRVVDMTDWI